MADQRNQKASPSGEKNPPPATQPEAGEGPLTGSGVSGEEKAERIREALADWAFAKTERLLMDSLRAKMAELQLLIDEMKRSRWKR